MTGRPDVVLVSFTADLLPVVQPWFDHPEVRRRLGGPESAGFVPDVDDPDREDTVYHLLRRTPRVGSVGRPSEARSL